MAGEGRLRASGSMGSERFPKRFGPGQPDGSLQALWIFSGSWASLSSDTSSAVPAWCLFFEFIGGSYTLVSVVFIPIVGR